MNSSLIKLVSVAVVSVAILAGCNEKKTVEAPKNESAPATSTQNAAEKVYGQLDGKDNGRLKP